MTESTQTLTEKVTIAEIDMEAYSEKSFTLRGEATKAKKEQLKALGGKWNSRLKGGAGWIFSNSKLVRVKEFLETGAELQLTSSDYQTVNYKLIRPRTGMKVAISMPNGTSTGTVTEARPQRNNTVTSAKVEITSGPMNPESSDDDFSEFTKRFEILIIANGDWKVLNQPMNHTVIFDAANSSAVPVAGGEASGTST